MIYSQKISRVVPLSDFGWKKVNILISRLKKNTTIFLIRERCSSIIIARNKVFMPFYEKNDLKNLSFSFVNWIKKTVVLGPKKTTVIEIEIQDKL